MRRVILYGFFSPSTLHTHLSISLDLRRSQSNNQVTTKDSQILNIHQNLTMKLSMPLPSALLLFVLQLSTALAQTRTVDAPLTSITLTDLGQAASILSRLSTYRDHLTADPKLSSVASVISTAIPDDVKASMIDVLAGDGEAGYIGTAGSDYGEGLGGSALTGSAKTTTTEFYTQKSWFTALPSDVKSYLASVDAEELKLATATGNAAMPTAVVGVGVGLAGVLGIALML